MKPITIIPRPRSRINYTNEEKIILKKLILNHKIVCSKKIDSSTRNAKKKAWETIAAEFSSTKGCTKRTPTQLIKLWENMKFIYRKNTRTVKERSDTAQQFLGRNANTDDSAVDQTSNDNIDAETKSLHDSDALYLLGRLDAHDSHFMTESCQAGNSSGVVTQSEDHRNSSGATNETCDSLASDFTMSDKHDFIENLIRVEEIENVRTGDEGREDEDQNENKEKWKQKSTEITYHDLLQFKKREMEKIYELKRAFHSAKSEALKAKEKAYKMKTAYYEYKMKKLRHFSVLTQHFLSL